MCCWLAQRVKNPDLGQHGRPQASGVRVAPARGAARRGAGERRSGGTEEQRNGGTEVYQGAVIPWLQPPGPVGLHVPMYRPVTERDVCRPTGCSLPALPAVAKPNGEHFGLRCLGWFRCAFSEPPLVAGVSRSQHPAVPAWLCLGKVPRIRLSWQSMAFTQSGGAAPLLQVLSRYQAAKQDLPQIVR